jgi:tetratricopeptide (TPR) repeat protein
MPRNKSKQARRADEWANQRSAQGISWAVVASILGSITFLVGAIVNWLDFINKLREGYQQFLWLALVILGVIWLIVLWLLFKQRNVYGILWLAVTILAGVVVWNGWHSYIQAREDKLVVLIAKFDGPEEVYGLRNEILEKLNENFLNDATVGIESVNEIITPEGDSSSPRAAKLGKSLQADLVIWGWYRPTENPNITIHIENLTPTQIEILKESETYEPKATLAQLESFEIQKQLGSETSTLISFLIGMLKYKTGDYQAAIERFEQVLLQNDISTFLSRFDLFFNLGYSYNELGDYQRAVQNYDQAIDINPESAAAYFNRGESYYYLQQYQEAVQNQNKAIEIDPEYVDAYISRGVDYYRLQQYQEAIQNQNKAIELFPFYAVPYLHRGLAYLESGQYNIAIADFDKAIQLQAGYAAAYRSRAEAYYYLQQYDRAIADYDQAIEIFPLDPNGYIYRGEVYYHLEQYKLALQDYDQAVRIDPEYAYAYLHRGMAYHSLQQYERALQDYDQAIRFEPEYADAYKNRGLALQALGKASEAEADFKKYEELTGEKP